MIEIITLFEGFEHLTKLLSASFGIIAAILVMVTLLDLKNRPYSKQESVEIFLGKVGKRMAAGLILYSLALCIGIGMTWSETLDTAHDLLAAAGLILLISAFWTVYRKVK